MAHVLCCCSHADVCVVTCVIHRYHSSLHGLGSFMMRWVREGEITIEAYIFSQQSKDAVQHLPA
jgi:hypothetical protein